VLSCSRGVVVPVPGSTALRANGIMPASFWKLSSGSAPSKGMPGSSSESPRRPKVWSRNCPQLVAHWVTSRSEYRFCSTSLNTRLLTWRTFGPATGAPIPSA
jgi:hypothetical protein